MLLDGAMVGVDEAQGLERVWVLFEDADSAQKSATNRAFAEALYNAGLAFQRCGSNDQAREKFGSIDIKLPYLRTTAAPKCVMHSDAGLIAGGIGLAHALEVQPDDVGSIAFPCTHIGGPDYLVVMLACGMPAVLLESFDPANAVATFARHDVTMAGGSTAFYLAFLNEQRKDPSKPVIPSLRMLNGGGAPKPPQEPWKSMPNTGKW